MWEVGGEPHTLGPGTELPSLPRPAGPAPSALYLGSTELWPVCFRGGCWTEAPLEGVGVQIWKVGGDRQQGWELFSVGAVAPPLGRPKSQNLLPLAEARALSQQWLDAPGCPEAAVRGQVIWGAMSMWRATAWPVQSSKGSKSKGRVFPGCCLQIAPGLQRWVQGA